MKARHEELRILADKLSALIGAAADAAAAVPTEDDRMARALVLLGIAEEHATALVEHVDLGSV